MKATTLARRLAEHWEGGSRADRVAGGLSAAYCWLLRLRELLYAAGVRRSRGVGCPVVSIGNLTVGGTGKTPAVELAVRTLADLGERPAVVSRGYGRRSRGLQVVADSVAIRAEPEHGGDEPFLLARRLPRVPVVVGANRYEAARVAVERLRATAVVLDDGFQHRTLRKDLEIVMARAARPWGNGRLLPAGPLRESLAALSRADLLVLTGPAAPAEWLRARQELARAAPALPVLCAHYVPVECFRAYGLAVLPLEVLRGARLVAFAGIGSPAAFWQTLAELGVQFVDRIAFPDHHWYSAGDLESLSTRARDLGATGLVTTEKDWVRLRRLVSEHPSCLVVSVRLQLVSGSSLWERAFETLCRPR